MVRTIKGTLKDGFEYRGTKQFGFEMCEVKTAGDLFAAEIESNGVENRLAFDGALMSRQLVSIGDCKGPFTIEQISLLTPRDYGVLRKAQVELNKLEDELPNVLSQSAPSGG